MAVRIAKPIAWTLLAILAVVLLLFSLVGILHTFRGTPISRVHVAGTGGATLDVADVSFRTAAEALTGTPILSGNDVEILGGIEAGMQVVSSANFQIDAESNMGSSIGSMPGMDSTAAAPSAVRPTPAAPAVDHSGH